MRKMTSQHKICEIKIKLNWIRHYWNFCPNNIMIINILLLLENCLFNEYSKIYESEFEIFLFYYLVYLLWQVPFKVKGAKEHENISFLSFCRYCRRSDWAAEGGGTSLHTHWWEIQPVNGTCHNLEEIWHVPFLQQFHLEAQCAENKFAASKDNLKMCLFPSIKNTIKMILSEKTSKMCCLRKNSECTKPELKCSIEDVEEYLVFKLKFYWVSLKWLHLQIPTWCAGADQNFTVIKKNAPQHMDRSKCDPGSPSMGLSQSAVCTCRGGNQGEQWALDSGHLHLLS